MGGEVMKENRSWILARHHNALEFIGVVNGMLSWVSDIDKAIRVSRRQDADALAEICEDAELVLQYDRFGNREEAWVVASKPADLPCRICGTTKVHRNTTMDTVYLFSIAKRLPCPLCNPVKATLYKEDFQLYIDNSPRLKGT